VAFMPKCLVCLAAYAGVGTVLGLGGPELCGAPASPAWPWAVLAGMAGLVLGVVRLFLLARTRRRSSAGSAALSGTARGHDHSPGVRDTNRSRPCGAAKSNTGPSGTIRVGLMSSCV
jgi:hypothetical protein